MNKLREIRMAMELNQRQLSEAAHTPQAIVSALEREVILPWPAVAQRLSKALGIPAEKLFPNDGDRVTPRKKEKITAKS